MTIPAGETAEPREVTLLVPSHISDECLRESFSLLEGIGVEIIGVTVDSDEFKPGTIEEKVEHSLRLSRKWFVSDECRKNHQTVLASLGLLKPIKKGGKRPAHAGITGIKYISAMLADKLTVDGWGRDSGNPQSIFYQILLSFTT